MGERKRVYSFYSWWIVFHALMEGFGEEARLTLKVCGVRMRNHILKLEHGNFQWDPRKSFFPLWGWLSSGRGCPGRLWTLHPWRYSIPNWSKPWLICCNWCCFGQGIGLENTRNPSRAKLYSDFVKLIFIVCAMSVVLHEFVVQLYDCIFCMIADNCKEMERGWSW